MPMPERLRRLARQGRRQVPRRAGSELQSGLPVARRRLQKSRARRKANPAAARPEIGLSTKGISPVWQGCCVRCCPAVRLARVSPGPRWASARLIYSPAQIGFQRGGVRRRPASTSRRVTSPASNRQVGDPAPAHGRLDALFQQPHIGCCNAPAEYSLRGIGGDMGKGPGDQSPRRAAMASA